MRRLLFGLMLCVLGIASRGRAACSAPCVQGKVCSGTAITTCAFTSNNTAGNLIAVGVEYGSNSITLTSITDTNNPTYSAGYGPTVQVSVGFTDYIKFVPNIASGANTVTIHPSSALTGDFVRIFLVELSGLSTTSPLDGTGNGTQASSGASQASGTWTATNGDLMIGWSVATGGSVVAGTGFTNDSTTTDGTGMLEWGVLSGTTAQALTTSTSGGYAIQGITLKQASGASGHCAACDLS